MTIEEAVKKLHWIKIADDGVLEMYLDHHMLQTFRLCEASFELSMIANIRSTQKAWSLEFGIAFHKMIEEFYLAKKADKFDLHTWLSQAVVEWHKAELDQFEEHKMYKTLGGVHGFVVMLGQYAEHFASEVDRLRPIGIEITFGKNKEVSLGAFQPYASDYLSHSEQFLKENKVRCYLTGRIDFLMDSGSSIGPLDHKTTAFFKGNPANPYDPQEGMTGYIYATSHILKTHFPELLGSRKVDRIWMNFAQIAPDSNPLKRFKRVPIFKTEWQLEQYRLRQIRTFNKIYDMVIGSATPDWNTAVCNNMFHSECQFKNLHRQNSGSAMLSILNNDFTIAKPWDTETVNEKENKQ